MNDVVECEINGDRVLAHVTAAPELVGRRFHVQIRISNAKRWQRGQRYEEVTGRQVVALYRRLGRPARAAAEQRELEAVA